MAATYILGPFRLDAETDTLFRGGEPVSLGHRAVALLRVLVERRGIPVSKDALMEAARSNKRPSCSTSRPSAGNRIVVTKLSKGEK
jgi:DNA-binding winged helix-turn-helix (wHTH) protein